jgi:hypothetical protein
MGIFRLVQFLDTGLQDGVGSRNAMANRDLVTQRCLRQIIGQARLKRLIRAGWLTPVERNAHSILFDPRDVHAALRRLEHQRCPPDRIEVMRVRDSEKLNGHSYVKKGRPQRPGVDEIVVDFRGFSNCTSLEQ